MKRTAIMTCFSPVFILLVFMGALPAAAESQGSLTVHITGFPSNEGFAMVALHDSEAAYKGDGTPDAAKTQIRITGQKVTVVFANLPYGWYGVSVFHDENANGTLDKNDMGIPKEAFGFSNNAKGMFGKPGYKDVKFQIDTPEKVFDIDLN